MTQQEMLDQMIRNQIGDLVIQNAALRVRIAELEAAVPQMPPPAPEVTKPNGQEKRV